MAKLLYNVRAYEATAAEFADDETVYPANALLIATDSGEIKKGNGTDAYADLASIGGGGGEGGAVAWEDITGVPAALTAAQAAGTASIRAIGTTATTAAAGNHSHAITADATSGLEAAANLQAAFVALSTRVKALEDAAG